MKNTKIIYQATLILISLFLIALPIIKVPVTVSATGVIRPTEENSIISANVNGRVLISNIKEDNQEVKKGDTLLVIASDQLHNKSSQQQILTSDLKAQLNDLNKLVKRQFKNLETGIYKEEASAFHQRIGETRARITLAQKDYNRSKTLYDQGIIPLAEYEKSLYTLQQLKSESNNISNQQIAQWETQKKEKEINLLQTKTDNHQLNIELNDYIILAPISGRVNKFNGIRASNFITVGQEIAEITPDKNLIAECLVPASNIGFIHIGQKSRFQIDTYNYNQWGMINGEVIDINKNIVYNEQNGQAFFKVRCKLDKNYLELRNGFKAEITKGNTLIARFYLTDRTLWQLLFDKVDDWFNPYLA